MSRSKLVSQAHLQRKALIYIRQSTPHQVLSNQESLRLQYALQQRAIAAIVQILKNPAYAGAFVYGKTRSVRKDPTSARTQEVRLPMDQWKIRVNDVYPAYITWETFEQIELDVYAVAVLTQQATAQQIAHAHQQRLERLRYEAALAQRQFSRVDPDNRLVAAELEKRWEAALAQLKQAEETQASQQICYDPLAALSPQLRVAFQAIGKHLPALWQQGRISRRHKKALLRALIDKVVVHRLTRDRVQARIVWKGAETTTLSIPVPVRYPRPTRGFPSKQKCFMRSLNSCSNTGKSC